jgi:FAD synthase
VLHKETVTTKNLTLKTDNLQNGVYFVKATVDGKTKTVKLVKE